MRGPGREHCARRAKIGYVSPMQLPVPLLKARLIRRYKRFLADAELSDGEVVTAHLANPGSMLSLLPENATIWLSRSDDPKRKLAYSWELVELPGGALSGVSTAHPNRIVAEALAEGRIAEAAGYETVRPETRYGAASRVDFLLSGGGAPDLYLEVKNVHLRREGDWAEFPDSVTARGAKHLDELAGMVRSGARAAMLYVVQRDDCARFRLAEDIDPTYAARFRAATAAGVDAFAYGCRIALEPLADDTARASITLDAPMPVIVEAAAGDGAEGGAAGSSDARAPQKRRRKKTAAAEGGPNRDHDGT